MLPKHNSQVSRETLLEWGFSKLIQEFDDHEASREGLGFRQLEPKIISKHFEDIGLDPEIANHNEISGLSGGQKVKVVLAGAMWNNPHLLVLDEATNYLDRDSLGGLAVAIREYKGGVVMISHNEEFVGALCPEQWHVADGRVTHKGHLAVAMDRFEDSRPGSSAASSAVSSASVSAVQSAANSGDEGDMKFKAKKKKKMTRQQMKDREVRRRLRHIEWLNSPKVCIFFQPFSFFSAVWAEMAIWPLLMAIREHLIPQTLTMKRKRSKLLFTSSTMGFNTVTTIDGVLLPCYFIWNAR